MPNSQESARKPDVSPALPRGEISADRLSVLEQYKARMAGHIPTSVTTVQLNPSQLAWGSNPTPPISELTKVWKEQQTNMVLDEKQALDPADIWRARMAALRTQANDQQTQSSPNGTLDAGIGIIHSPSGKHDMESGRHDMVIDNVPQPSAQSSEQGKSIAIDSSHLRAAQIPAANNSDTFLERIFSLMSKRETLLKSCLNNLEDSQQRKSTESKFSDADLDSLYALIKAKTPYGSRQEILAKIRATEQEAAGVAESETGTLLDLDRIQQELQAADKLCRQSFVDT
ncbi:hypothetical protein CPB83DRAFT_897369 [Crepidotus variabilis]|uniref:Uncharacterized protein n=1 Tax=Crepidotus variabilis TaxID=179855 RepID=A0A9P6JLV0_9AGAR|nr:hypothetical protein CPB83DRAFT_897369 [Crepidotus variabilis]